MLLFAPSTNITPAWALYPLRLAGQVPSDRCPRENVGVHVCMGAGGEAVRT